MTRAPDCIEGPRGRSYEILYAKEEAMGEAHYNARLVWSGGALGPTKSVESYSREFQAEFEGKPPLRGSADPAFTAIPHSTIPKTCS